MAGRRTDAVVLYDASGRPMRVAAQGWDAAGQGRRARGWQPSGATINALLAGDLDTLRRRSRDAVRGNAWAESAVSSFVSNVVGNGIMPRPNTENDEFRRQILEAWEEWVEECDADGCSDFYGMQATICRGVREGAETFVRFRPRRASDGLSVPLQLQVLESELCDASFHRDLGLGRTIKNGIEFNSIGQRRAYHFWRQHPGELVGFRGGERTPVPADQVMHVFQVLRPGQVRGFPGLASVLTLLHDLGRYNDGEVMRKLVTALFAGFITKPATEGDPLGFGSEGTDDDDVELFKLEPGTMQELAPGEEVSFSQPGEVGSTYADFMRMQLRAIAVGAGVTYEQLSGDLSDVNFSSIRFGLMEARRSFEQIQKHVMVFQLCRRTWRRWFETAVLAGRIQIPEAEKPRLARLLRPKWIPTPGWEYVEPEKDARAAVRRIRAGLSTRTQEAARTGLDVEEIDRQLAADKAREEKLGLVLDTDASRGPQGGMGPGEGEQSNAAAAAEDAA